MEDFGCMVNTACFFLRWKTVDVKMRQEAVRNRLSVTQFLNLLGTFERESSSPLVFKEADEDEHVRMFQLVAVGRPRTA